MGSKEGIGRGAEHAGGNAGAISLDEVWRENRHWISAVLMVHKPRGADLEDLLQDVAHSLVSNAGEIRDPDALGPWLRTVAINTARAEGRKHTRRSRLAPVSGQDPAGTAAPRSGLDRTERAEVMRWVEQLPLNYREPLLLRSVRGMTNRQVGRILGLTEAAVETRVARARRMLRMSMRADELTSEPIERSGA